MYLISEVFRKRAINPILRILEYHYNSEIIPEFEIDGWKFKFLVFDVEEETKKANLAKIQIDAGVRTVNEIRREDGLEEVEWGDDDPKRNQGNNINFPGNPGNPLAQEESRKKEESKPKDKKEEKKPEKKAIDNPLIPKAGEQMNDEKLRISIV